MQIKYNEEGIVIMQYNLHDEDDVMAVANALEYGKARVAEDSQQQYDYLLQLVKAARLLN